MCFGCLSPKVTLEDNERILVLDCDDTLYRNDGEMTRAITRNMEAYCTDRLNLEGGMCYKLYKEYGTTVNGLLKKGLIKQEDVDDWLETTHTIPTEPKDIIKPDEKLRSFLLKVQVQMFVFTAGISSHVKRCCQALGVEDLIFPDSRPVIDTRTCQLITKYSPEAFAICLTEMECFLKKDINPKNLIFVDDNLKNIQCAKKCGWGVCILVGARPGGKAERTTELEGVDYVIEHLSELASIDELQDLFVDDKVVEVNTK